MQRPTHAPYGIFAPSEVHQGTVVEAAGRTCRTPFFSNPLDISKYSVMQGANESNDPQPNYLSNWASRLGPKTSSRAVSFTALSIRRLEGKPRSTPKVDSDTLFTPSHIPKRIPSVEDLAIKPSPIRSPRKREINLPFLTRDSNTRVASREHDDRITNMEKSMEKSYNEFKERMDGMTTESNSLREVIEVYKARGESLMSAAIVALLRFRIVTDLDAIKIQLNRSNVSLQTEVEASRSRAKTATDNLEDAKRYHSIQLEDLQRKCSLELEDAKRHSQEEIRRLLREHGAEMDDLKKRLETALENETLRRQNELQAATAEGELVQQKAQEELDRQREITRAAEESLQEIREDLKRERGVNSELRNKIMESSSTSTSLEGTIRSLRAHIEFLESDNKSQSNAFVDLETRLQKALKSAAEANEKLIKEETLRRKLHNQVQELKGNIRVFCRVRPALPSEPGSQAAQIKFPDNGTDAKEVEILGPEEKSSLGNITTKTNAFSFDRVFTPESVNEDVFAEISQLVQSALDGYNVCIFCYGQTGSGRYHPYLHIFTIAEQIKGKTHTMSSEDGMITRAVHQIYTTAKSLEEKGWKYSMEGQFVEVYNENLNDLLGKADELDKKKHEIRHDMQKCKTTITDITSVQLDSPDEVESILRRASANRSVAATKANERSSRSHSVFILKLTGQNSTTGEKSEGTLNLVDLAGSERLSHSKAVGDRLKETQNINKSLSCLGDVIGALGLGRDGGHIPYRNSKVSPRKMNLGSACCNELSLERY